MNPAVTTELEAKVGRYAAEAQALVITDQQTFDLAAERLVALRALEKEIVEHHAEMRERTLRAWQAVIAAEKKLAGPVLEAISIYRERIVVYEAAQRRIEAEARRQAEIEALRKAEVERERELEAAEAQGADAREIASIAAAPLPMVVPEAPPATFRQAPGVSTASNWKGEVTSMFALIQAAAAGQVSMAVLMPNQTAINQLAKASRGTLTVPGIRFYDDRTVRTRR